jgi:hypothetical protein
MISIEATKKGHLSVDYEKRKHWLVTKIRNVSGNDDAIYSLCSRISKRLGAQARAVRQGKGEKVIEIQGKHEETRVEEVLARENVKIVGLRRKVEVVPKREEEERKERAKPRHANKKYWDTKTGLIKDSVKRGGEEDNGEDPVKPEDVLRVKQLRETNKEFARFCELMRRYPFWSHRYDKLAAMYFEKRNGKEDEEDEERMRKRRRCEIAFEEEEEDVRDEDRRQQNHPKSLEDLGMVASVSDFRMSREERAKAAKERMTAAKSAVGPQDATRESKQRVEEYEDIATKMLRMRGFAPASSKKKPATSTTAITTTTTRQKPAMPPKKKKKDVRAGIPIGTSVGFGRKAWSQKQFDEEDLRMSTTDEEEEEEEENFQRVASRPLVGGRFLDNKRKDESTFPSLPLSRAAPPTRAPEHRLPHEEFQQTTMSEEEALKLALSLSADEHARERIKLDEELERELEVARAVSLSSREEEEEARKQSSLSDDIAQTLRQLGFDRDVSETLANDVLPAMPTRQDVIDLLGTLGIEKHVAADFANFVVLNNTHEEDEKDLASPSRIIIDDDEDTAETTTFFNLSLRELTGADSNRDLIEYVQTMEHREDAGEFLRDSFGGNEETARLGQLIWDARKSR